MNISKTNKKKVNKSLNLRHVNCDYCNSDNYKVLIRSEDYFFNKIQGEFEIVKCLNCNLIYTNPRIREEVLTQKYINILNYDNRPLNFREKKGILLPFGKEFLTDFFKYPLCKKKVLRKIIQYPNFLRYKKKWQSRCIIPSYIKDGKILEIGCSYGSYLFLLKKLGWLVKGIELNKEAVNYAVNNLNLDVKNTSIEDYKTDISFNLIYLSMVLEHVESPQEVLKKCFSLLKPNGKLILRIPDFSGCEVRIYKKYAYTLQLPYHLYHFTPNSIKNYLIKNKFKKIKIIHENSDRDLIAPLSYILKDNPNNLFIKCVLKFFSNKFIRKTMIKTIINIFSFLSMTSRMTVIAKK